MKLVNKYLCPIIILYFSVVILSLTNCSSDSGSPSKPATDTTNKNNNNNNNNNNTDTTKKDTLSLKTYYGYNFSLKIITANPDSTDVHIAIYTVDHLMTIAVAAKNSKIKYYDAKPDPSKITETEVNGWDDVAPNPSTKVVPKKGFYYIVKAKSGKFYMLNTVDILNTVYPMPKWEFKFLWEEVKLGS